MIMNYELWFSILDFCDAGVHFPEEYRACFKRNMRWETVTSVQLTFPDTHVCDISFEWNITPLFESDSERSKHN